MQRVEAARAVERFRLPGEGGRKVMHAVLGVAGGTIFLSDMGALEEPRASPSRSASRTPQPSTR